MKEWMRPTAPALLALVLTACAMTLGTARAGRPSRQGAVAPRWATGTLLVGAVAGGLLAGSAGFLAAQTPSAVRLDAFDRTYPPNLAAPDWDTRKIAPLMGKGETHFFQFVHREGEHHIHLRSGKNNSFTVGSKNAFQLQEWPILEWEWKVVTLPEGGDVRVKARDDQAGSVCVVVDPGLRGFDSLCYIWENEGPRGAEVTSTKRAASKYVILRAADSDPLGKWLPERRNIYQDYKRLFGQEPGAEAVIGVQIDSDDTKSSAEAYYRNIFSKRR